MAITRCTFGFHRWVMLDHWLPLFGDRRRCALCGVEQKLVPDWGGWSAGYWERVKKDKAP